MNGSLRCWASLPADALAYIINECELCQSDVASIRLVCMHWRATTNSHLKSLAPACTSLEQVAGIAQRFPFLTNCDLTRCDTRLVGHASLCRDASARLSTLLGALSRMPSLTSLHISDTFSERMGQKHWASLVCAQALVDVTQSPVVTPQMTPEVTSTASLSLDVASDTSPAAAGGVTDTSNGGGESAAAAASSSGVNTLASVGAALAAVSISPTNTAGSVSSLQFCTSAPPSSCKAHADDFTHDPTAVAIALDDGEDGDSADTNHATCDGAPVSVPAIDEGPQPTVPALTAADLSPPVPASATGPGGHAGSANVAAVDAASALPSPPPQPTPPPLVLDAAELADPGIKSFARAIARPGATHQHAFWLPDWCGRLSGLQELHIRGRQRPSAGLPPCLLWLHAGRTAPQLTSLCLVRLSLVTLPEQLQHLTGLTRLVAQDCSLSLMPRGLASGLSQLQYMDLSLNGLTALPSDFTQLTSLRHLDLQRNKLVSLPPDIGRLSAVTCLLLNNNQLRQLPPSLAALRHVEVLSCSYNWLGGMGPSLPLLCSLPRLRRLELACVSDVRCRLVPPQELRLLAAHLTQLDLGANNLVPADVLGTLTSVRSLVLSDCGLLAVPPWVRRLAPSLQHLDLSNNSLSELPTWLSACTRLRFISIAHNRLSLRVPPAVLEQMPQLEVVESE